MSILKGIAVINVFGVGCLGLGLVSVVVGGAWGIVFLVWIAFWAIVGLLAELDKPSYW